MNHSQLNEPIIKTEKLCKRFQYIWAVKNISLDINRNTIIGFVGPNGAGKSTLLQLLATNITPTQGKIFFQGQSLGNRTENYRQKLGLLSYFSLLYDDLTGNENINFWLNLYNKQPWNQLRITKDEYILLNAKQFGIEHWLNRLVSDLSTGMRKKVDFLRMILTQPEIFFLDEPFSGMDLVNIKFFKTELLKLKKKNQVTICIASHNIETMIELCDKIYLLKAGKIIKIFKKEDASKDSLKLLFHNST